MFDQGQNPGRGTGHPVLHGCQTRLPLRCRRLGFGLLAPAQAQRAPALTVYKRQLGIPQALWSCHTALVDGYAVEGHVPATDIKRLLRERPRAIGLAAPGMPVGSPGMEQGAGQPYSTVLFDGHSSRVFERH